MTCPVYLWRGKFLAWRHNQILIFTMSQQHIIVLWRFLETKCAICHLKHVIKGNFEMKNKENRLKHKR